MSPILGRCIPGLELCTRGSDLQAIPTDCQDFSLTRPSGDKEVTCHMLQTGLLYKNRELPGELPHVAVYAGHLTQSLLEELLFKPSISLPSRAA